MAYKKHWYIEYNKKGRNDDGEITDIVITTTKSKNKLVKSPLVNIKALRQTEEAYKIIKYTP